jgi:hypothetical protein
MDWESSALTLDPNMIYALKFRGFFSKEIAGSRSISLGEEGLKVGMAK